MQRDSFMVTVTKSASISLARIKEDVSISYKYFEQNYKRFHEFRKYIFKESITEQQRSAMIQLHRPVLEFNILEAYISRLLGEFAQQEPSIVVSPAEGVPVLDEILDIVEGHIRNILKVADKDSFSYEVYKDLLSGGFSVAKVWTDYSSPMSFHQQIFLTRAFDPTLCGFDPAARAPHKGDGRYCFEVFPMELEEFERQYPDANMQGVSYSRDVEGFNWSYKDSVGKKIVLVVDYFEKKKKRTRIVRIADGRIMTVKDYEKMKAHWEEMLYIEQIPDIMGNPRWTELETVHRYRFVDNQILEHEETDYSYLPYVFIDGNSINLTQGTSNTTYQMTRPYVYHAKGVQDLKNFAGSSLANFLENQIQSKFIIMKEAIPQEDDYIEALTNIQKSNTIVVNAFYENDPNKQIPMPIREVVNTGAPPEIMGAFQVTDPTTQTILGSYASNLGRDDTRLSGKAVIESATQGNAAAMPYVVGYLQGLTQIGNIIVDLIPKYLIGKRTIPVMDSNGDQDYVEINMEGRPVLNYKERAIKVNVEAGVNFQVQKNKALEQIVALMQASSQFGQFMNSPQGLKILVKNLTIYGAENLQEAIDPYLEEQAQQQQQAMEMQQKAMSQNPQMLRAQAELMRVQTQSEQNQIENQFEIARISTEKQVADAKILEAEAKVSQAQIDSAVRLEESQTRLEVHALETAGKLAEVRQREEAHGLHVHKSVKELLKGIENE
jgi:hypothetical protein